MTLTPKRRCRFSRTSNSSSSSSASSVPSNPLTPTDLDGTPSWWSSPSTHSLQFSSNGTNNSGSGRGSNRFLSLRLEADSLKNMDLLSLSDPFAIVCIRRRSGELISLGRTSTVWDSLNPRWSEEFLVSEDEILAGSDLMVDVYDRDSDEEDLKRMDFLGRAAVQLAEVVAGPDWGARKRVLLQGDKESKGLSQKKGQWGGLTVLGEWVDKRMRELGGEGDDLVRFAIKSCLLRKKGLIVGQFYEIQRERLERCGKTTWMVVYRSENATRAAEEHGYAVFEPAELSRRELYNGDRGRRLRIVFYKRSLRGAHRVISFAQASLVEMGKLFRSTLVASLPLEPDESASLGMLVISGWMEGTEHGRKVLEVTLQAEHLARADLHSVPEYIRAGGKTGADRLGRLSDKLMKYVSLH